MEVWSFPDLGLAQVNHQDGPLVLDHDGAEFVYVALGKFLTEQGVVLGQAAPAPPDPGPTPGAPLCVCRRTTEQLTLPAGLQRRVLRADRNTGEAVYLTLWACRFAGCGEVRMMWGPTP